MDGYALNHAIHRPGGIRNVRRQSQRYRPKQRQGLRECHVGQAELEIGQRSRTGRTRVQHDSVRIIMVIPSRRERDHPPRDRIAPQLAQQIEIVLTRVGIVTDESHDQSAAVDDGLRAVPEPERRLADAHHSLW